MARKRIAYLQGLGQVSRSALEQLVEVFPGVVLAGEEQGR
jgi:hypothetical protein